MTSATERIVRWIAPRNRTSGMLLVCALLAGVLVATLGAGYTASRSLLDSGSVYLPKSQGMVGVNGETQKIEAEARALAQGKNEIEIVILASGQVAVVDKPANTVRLVDPGTMQPKGPIDLPDTPGPESPSQVKPIVLGPPDSGYLGSGDVVSQIDEDGKQSSPAKLPARLAGPAVPDPVEGIWVLIDGGQVVHVVRGEIRKKVTPDQRIEHLTIADGRPIGITVTGELLDLSASHRVGNEPVPAGPAVLVGSANGAGRWILVIDPHRGQLVAVDVHTGTSRTFGDLPTDTDLGQPVQVGDRVYIPDYTKHLLHVIDVGLRQRLEPVKVPGETPRFTLEVRAGRVWANDQFDRRARLIDDKGSQGLIDKGPGADLTDTENPKGPEGQNPTEETTEPEPSRPPSTPRPEPTQKPAPTPSPQPAPKVEVPRIAPGTPIGQACQQVQQAGLECVPVAVGDGGSTDTVVDQNPTDPPAGTPVPKSYRVVVRHYGRTPVPYVVNRYTDDACKRLTDARLKCVKQPSSGVAPRPEDLDVVKGQNPANTKAATDTDVTIDYFDKAPMYDYVGQTGAGACLAFKQTYRKMDCQVVEGATEQQSRKPAGVVYTQQPAAGATVQMGEPAAVVVTFTVVKGSPLVPDLRGKLPGDACASLPQIYTCDSRAEDYLAKLPVVFAQEPAPGTPLDPGGTIVIHSPRYTPVPLHKYQRTNGDPVYLLRKEGYANPAYAIDNGLMGYGYEENIPQSGTAPLFSHLCVGDTTTCLGYDRNHYVSRGGVVQHSGWKVTSEPESLRVISNCGAGMVQIYRVLNKPNGNSVYQYSIEKAPGGIYTEPLGCLWS